MAALAHHYTPCDGAPAASNDLTSAVATGATAPRTRAPWQKDRLIAGRYALERKLGQGAMGDVWLAEDKLLRKQVALKVLQLELAQKRDTVRRFLREVALAHSVTHPRVVRIYDTGTEEGLPFFTMEYLQGQSLEERLAGPKNEQLSFREIRRIATDVLDAMEAAHRVGVVHRDLKPGNVMLTHAGAIVMDFGVAGIEEAPIGLPSADSLRALIRTEAGTIFGSPAYMAPELWEGASASAQSDIYAFGVLLYQMVTGRLPFAAETAAGYLQQLSTGRAPALRSFRRDTPWYLLRLVGRCMAADPLLRPTDAAAAANLIAPLRSKHRRRTMLVFASAVALLGGGSWWKLRSPGQARGLPSATARAHLSAAVRTFDAGDTQAARRQLDRLALRTPDSAALVFWRATVHHALADNVGRQRVCTVESVRGDAAWRALVTAACGDRYQFSQEALLELEDPGSSATPQLLPLIVQWNLLPRVEAELDAQGPMHDQARQLLTVLDEHEHEHEHDALWAMPVRLQLARVDLQLALGRPHQAERRLNTLVQGHPHTPLFAKRSAWLSGHLGQDDRSQTLAVQLRPSDPGPWLERHMAAGKLHLAWSQIESYANTTAGAGLRLTWCAYAWRFGVTPCPAQCRNLQPGLVAALWNGQGTATTAIGQSILEREADIANERCAATVAPPSLLTHAPAGFELRRAELEVEAALCASPSPARMGPAQDLANRLIAVAPTNPWILLLLARLDDRADAPRKALARRLEAAERWRDADPGLPVADDLRRAVGTASANPAK